MTVSIALQALTLRRCTTTQDYTAATAILEPLATQQPQESKSTTTNIELRSALGRVYLQAGQLDRAEAHFAAVAAAAAAAAAADTDTGGTHETTKTLNAAFLASARGNWDTAGTLLRELVEQDEANYAVRLCSSVHISDCLPK